MKTLRSLLLLMAFLVSTPSFAQVASSTEGTAEQEFQDDPIDPRYKQTNVFETMARSFIKTLTKDLGEEAVKKILIAEATKGMNEEEAKKASAQIGEYVGYGVAGWTVYESAVQYRKGKSESEKYYAASTAASAVIACVPGWGSLVAGLITAHNLASRMVSASYAKDTGKEILRLQIDTLRVYNEILKKDHSLARAEERALRSILTELLVAQRLVQTSRQAYQDQCVTRDPRSDFDTEREAKAYDDCIVISLNVLTSMELFVGIYKDLLHFPTSHILTATYLKVKMEKTRVALLEKVSTVEDELKLTRQTMTTRLRELNELRASMFKSMLNESDEVQIQKKRLQCRRVLRASGLRLFAASRERGRLRKAGLTAAVEDYRFNRDYFCEGVQFDSATGAMDRLNRLVDQYTVELAL